MTELFLSNKVGCMTEPTINHPDLWLRALPRPTVDGHKYHRGHAAILGAPVLTGATRLAAEACSRIGAGLVTVLGGEAADIYRKTLPADIMVPAAKLAQLRGVTAVLVGPGGLGAEGREAALEADGACPLILDADAISLGGKCADNRPCILTPHEGEFARAFPDLTGSREARVHGAAKALGAFIVLKGPETFIASPDGTIVRNTHASPWLAKAGTGDVLAGFVTGLIAQGMQPALAACAAVWIHGEAARRFGVGLVAGDLSSLVPAILADLLQA